MTEAKYVQVLSAENGRHAIYLFGENKEQIDMVVSDLVMPDMGGKELYQELVQSYANGEPLRMLLVPGYSLDALAQWQLENSVIKWLQKPFALRVAEMLANGESG